MAEILGRGGGGWGCTVDPRLSGPRLSMQHLYYPAWEFNDIHYLCMYPADFSLIRIAKRGVAGACRCPDEAPQISSMGN